VRELDEEQSALRQERDRALDEIARGSEDLTNLDEQLDTVREQLHSKSKTIDKLVREMNALEIELKGMRETARMAEHKYEVLQCEAVALQRASVSTTQRLEEEIQQLKLRIAEMLTPSDDV
jgi:chromosome segregation ATPase